MTPKVPHPSKVDRGLLAHIKRCIQSPTFCSSNTAFAILDSKKKIEKGNIFSVFPTQQIKLGLKLKHILALATLNQKWSISELIELETLALVRILVFDNRPIV